VLGGALVLGAALLYLVVIPAEITVPKIAVGGGMGGIAASPIFFPRLAAALLGVLGAILLVRGHTRRQSLGDGEGFPFDRIEVMRFAGGAAILAVYAALLDSVGYLLLTPAALVLLCVFLGYRRWLVITVTAVAFTALVYFGFRYGMKILLPEGPIG
jgi:hypothetical protein